MNVSAETLKLIAELCERVEGWGVVAELTRFGVLLRADKHCGRLKHHKSRIVSWEQIAASKTPGCLIAGVLHSMTGSFLRRYEDVG